MSHDKKAINTEVWITLSKTGYDITSCFLLLLWCSGLVPMSTEAVLNGLFLILFLIINFSFCMLSTFCLLYQTSVKWINNISQNQSTLDDNLRCGLSSCVVIQKLWSAKKMLSNWSDFQEKSQLIPTWHFPSLKWKDNYMDWFWLKSSGLKLLASITAGRGNCLKVRHKQEGYKTNVLSVTFLTGQSKRKDKMRKSGLCSSGSNLSSADRLFINGGACWWIKFMLKPIRRCAYHLLC